MLKILTARYCLGDSGDYWGRTLRQHILEEIGMTPSTTDAALFFKKIGDQLAGL